MKKFYFHLTFFFLLCSFFMKAQDLHYSQFYNSPLNLNPSHVGLFNGDKRFNLSFRDQWRFVPVAWTTFSLAYDFKHYLKSDNNFLGFGANLNYDRQGDSKLTLTGLNVGASYNRVINPKNLLSGGLMIGLNGRGYNATNLTWDKQWNGVAFNSSLGSGENFDVRRVLLFELATGLNYRYQVSERTKVDAGIGAYHLHQPSTTFYDVPKESLPLHMTYSLIGSVQLMKSLDLQVTGMYQAQEEYNETLIGALAKIYVNHKRGKETQFHVGLGYRTAGSLIPTFAVQYNEWYGSFSYDLDNNGFNDITTVRRGGPEFHLRYIIKKVQALNTRKNCPIY